jgi:hypothetical protein
VYFPGWSLRDNYRRGVLYLAGVLEHKNIIPVGSMMYDFWDYCLGGWDTDAMSEEFEFIIPIDSNTSWATLYVPMNRDGVFVNS